MTAVEDDTFKSIPAENLNDTAMTQAFTPGRYTPTKLDEEEDKVEDETIGKKCGSFLLLSNRHVYIRYTIYYFFASLVYVLCFFGRWRG